MVARSTAIGLPDLYESDETAWLEAMAGMIRGGHSAELDYLHLAEYLEDMARRDKREVGSRLAVLVAHLLKWQYQPERRSGSWRVTVEQQQQELIQLLESGVLRNHADEILAKAYANGIRQAVAETGLPASTFPAECSYTVDTLLSAELKDE
jgi:Domain of unknown function DUF29